MLPNAGLSRDLYGLTQSVCNFLSDFISYYFFLYSLCFSHLELFTILTYDRHIPALGSLPWLFPLPGAFFRQIGTWLTHFFKSFLPSIFFIRPILTSLLNFNSPISDLQHSQCPHPSPHFS